MADLFDQFDALFRGEQVEDPPHPAVVNKFLASDPDFAWFAKELVLFTWDPEMSWEVWRGAVPRLSSAPRMTYTAPKKPPSADKLVQAIMEREHLPRAEAEEAVDFILQFHGTAQAEQLCLHYGVDPDKMKWEEDDEG